MKSNRCHVRTSLRGSRTRFHDAHSGRRGDWLIQTLGLFLAFSQGRCGVWILWPLHREFCFPHPCSTLYPSSQEPNGLDGSVCRPTAGSRPGPHPALEMPHKRSRDARGVVGNGETLVALTACWQARCNSALIGQRRACEGVRFEVFQQKICPLGVARAAHNAA